MQSSEWRSYAAMALVTFVTLYLLVASVVFGLRHPWATDTERLLHIGDALAFRTLDYEEMRPREGR